MTIVARLQELGTPERLLAAAAGAAQVVWGDYFGAALLVLLVSNFFDWVAGRWAARGQKRFSKTESRRGIMRKALAIMAVMIVRLIEVVLEGAGVPTGGLVAVAITAGLILEDVESIERHRMSIGAKPIPLLSWAVTKLRELTTGDKRTESRPAEEVVES